MKKFYASFAILTVFLGFCFQNIEAQKTVIEDFEVSADVPQWINANIWYSDFNSKGRATQNKS